MSRKLVQHAARMFSKLPEEEQLPKRKNLKERFFELLPKEFSRQQYLEVVVKDHSKVFWAELGKHEKKWKELDGRMRGMMM